MANSLGDIIKLPVKAWLVIAGSTFDIHDVSLMFAASALPTANLSLATGYTFKGAKVFDVSKLPLFYEGAEGEVWVDFTGSSDLPGLPRAPTMVFRGYVSAVSPSVSFESGSTFGVQLQHAGMADLSSGSTVQWGAMLSTGRPDPALTLEGMTGIVLTGGEFTTTGLRPVLLKIYEVFMKSANQLTGSGTKFAACAGVRDLNAVALTALGKLTGSQLILRGELGSSNTMFDFLKQRLGSDLWTMSVAEQLQTIGQDLFFRCIPHGDGSVEIVPLTTFGPEFAKITGEHIFQFAPTYAPNRRVAGVVFTARSPNGSWAAAGNIGGCYVFPQTVVRAGAVQPIELPAWLSASVAVTQRNPGVDVIAHPATVGNQTQGADMTPDVKASIEATAATYGDQFAREIARKLRYQDCTAQVTTHFRTDIGVLSTLRVDAPITLDQEATIYGRVDTLTLSISSQGGAALATYGLSYVRSAETQRRIIDDGGDKHPIYTDTWAGSAL